MNNLCAVNVIHWFHHHLSLCRPLMYCDLFNSNWGFPAWCSLFRTLPFTPLAIRLITDWSSWKRISESVLKTTTLSRVPLLDCWFEQPVLDTTFLIDQAPYCTGWIASSPCTGKCLKAVSMVHLLLQGARVKDFHQHCRSDAARRQGIRNGDIGSNSYRVT